MIPATIEDRRPGRSARILATVLLVSACLSAAGPDIPGRDDPKRDVGKLLGEYRESGDSPQRRAEVVERILGLGADAAGRLGSLVRSDLEKRLSGYRERFTREAAPLLKARRSKTRELEKLRAQVLSVTRSPSLTKELILTKADPAMERLNEVLFLDPFIVVEQSPQLQAMRRDIEDLGATWRRCIEKQQIAAAGAPNDDWGFEEIVQRHERFAMALFMLVSSSKRKLLVENHKTAWKIDTGEALGILDLNIMRLMLGLRPLRTDAKLCAAARDHSGDMRTKGFFAHTSPVPGKTTFSQRASRFGTSASSENISRGYRSPYQTNRGWFHSPGHHRNMLSSHSRIGLGRSGSFWTQMFG